MTCCGHCGYPTTPGPNGTDWCFVYGTHGQFVDGAAALFEPGEFAHLVALSIEHVDQQRAERYRHLRAVS